MLTKGPHKAMRQVHTNTSNNITIDSVYRLLGDSQDLGQSCGAVSGKFLVREKPQGQPLQHRDQMSVHTHRILLSEHQAWQKGLVCNGGLGGVGTT